MRLMVRVRAGDTTIRRMADTWKEILNEAAPDTAIRRMTSTWEEFLNEAAPRLWRNGTSLKQFLANIYAQGRQTAAQLKDDADIKYRSIKCTPAPGSSTGHDKLTAAIANFLLANEKLPVEDRCSSRFAAHMVIRAVGFSHPSFRQHLLVHEVFTNPKPFAGLEPADMSLKTYGGDRLTIEEKGSVGLMGLDGEIVKLNNCLHVPDGDNSPVPILDLLDAGLTLAFEPDRSITARHPNGDLALHFKVE